MIGLVLTLSFLLTGCEGPSPDKASLKYSEDLYDGCVQCHGENGEGNQDLGAPAIAGLERWYIKAQLRKFKKSQRGWHIDDMAGKRMQPMAMAMDTDEKVDIIAAYVASLPRTNPAPTLEGGNPETGKIYFATCVQCHGADARGNIDEFGPPLAGASDWYLLTQLQNFKAGCARHARGRRHGGQDAAVLDDAAHRTGDERRHRVHWHVIGIGCEGLTDGW